MTFQDLGQNSMTFQAWNPIIKFHDFPGFPGPVRTLEEENGEFFKTRKIIAHVTRHQLVAWLSSSSASATGPWATKFAASPAAGLASTSRQSSVADMFQSKFPTISGRARTECVAKLIASDLKPVVSNDALQHLLAFCCGASICNGIPPRSTPD